MSIASGCVYRRHDPLGLNGTWQIRFRSAILSYPILSYPILSCPVLSCPVLSYPILSYPILSYPILSYPILSYPILSYPILDSVKPAQLRKPVPEWVRSKWNRTALISCKHSLMFAFRDRMSFISVTQAKKVISLTCEFELHTSPNRKVTRAWDQD